MVNNYSTLCKQPTIVKYAQQYRNGIQSHTLSRHGIGYIVRGQKHIYFGDVRHEINRGEIFYLNTGHHYMEDIPLDGKPFEQIVFYYDNESINRILNHLSINYQLNINNEHTCERCHNQPLVTYPAWSMLKNFYQTINQYIKEDVFGQDDAAENLKMTELIYLILSNNDCCIKSKILSNIDIETESFEQIVNNSIFNQTSLEDLAALTNRSVTSFKKEFKNHFYESPHKWLVKQRLMHSRLLLISTQKPISVIAKECVFPNTSHFIKSFKKDYRLTPATYRAQNVNINLQSADTTAISNTI